MALPAEEKLAEKPQVKNSQTLVLSFLLYLTGTHPEELRKVHCRVDIVPALKEKLNIQNKDQQNSARSHLTILNMDLEKEIPCKTQGQMEKSKQAKQDYNSTVKC